MSEGPRASPVHWHRVRGPEEPGQRQVPASALAGSLAHRGCSLHYLSFTSRPGSTKLFLYAISSKKVLQRIF